MGVHHKILIVGGGNAGPSTAARLRGAGQSDIAVPEPSDKHCYQPLWTLVGGGRAPQEESVRDRSSLMPQGVAEALESPAASSTYRTTWHPRPGT